MAWECFADTQVCGLVGIDGIINPKVYHNILVYHASTFGRRLVGQNFVFQQRPKHTSKLCTNYLQKNEVLKL